MKVENQKRKSIFLKDTKKNIKTMRNKFDVKIKNKIK
jgi:hypothetical protein